MCGTFLVEDGNLFWHHESIISGFDLKSIFLFLPFPFFDMQQVPLSFCYRPIATAPCGQLFLVRGRKSFLHVPK